MSNDNESAIIYQSQKLLESCLAPTLIFMIAGLVAFVTGSISMVAVFRNKDLRTKFFLLYGGVAINDTLMGIAYIAVAIKRIVKQIIGDGDVTTRLNCCYESLILYFTQTLALYLALTLALDRTVSTITPMKYKFMTYYNLVVPLIIGAVGLSLFETTYMLIQGYGSPDDILPSCGTGNCWTNFSYSITLYSHLCVSLLVISLNGGLLVLVRYLLRRAKRHKSQGWVAHVKTNLQVKVMKTLTIMVLSHATSHISTRLGLVILLFQSDINPELTLAGSTMRNLVVINAALHFFIYYSTSIEFRTAVNKLFPSLQDNTIHPATTRTGPI